MSIIYASVSRKPVIPPVPDDPRLPVVPYRLAIIKQSTSASDYGDMSNPPQTSPLMDHPVGRTKGHTIIYNDPWIDYMRLIQDEKAWRWWKTPHANNFNRNHNRDGFSGSTNPPIAESICLPNNFIGMDMLTATHGRAVGYVNTFNPMDHLHPEIDNFWNFPYIFQKLSAHNSEGRIINVGSGFDAYAPMVRTNGMEAWALRTNLEMFQDLPFDVTYEGKSYHITGYCLQGCSVYGHAEEMDVPLRLARAPGELVHPTTWYLHEVSVVPPVRN